MSERTIKVELTTAEFERFLGAQHSYVVSLKVKSQDRRLKGVDRSDAERKHIDAQARYYTLETMLDE